MRATDSDILKLVNSDHLKVSFLDALILYMPRVNLKYGFIRIENLSRTESIQICLVLLAIFSYITCAK